MTRQAALSIKDEYAKATSIKRHQAIVQDHIVGTIRWPDCGVAGDFRNQTEMLKPYSTFAIYLVVGLGISVHSTADASQPERTISGSRLTKTCKQELQKEAVGSFRFGEKWLGEPFGWHEVANQRWPQITLRDEVHDVVFTAVYFNDEWRGVHIETEGKAIIHCDGPDNNLYFALGYANWRWEDYWGGPTKEVKIISLADCKADCGRAKSTTIVFQRTSIEWLVSSLTGDLADIPRYALDAHPYGFTELISKKNQPAMHWFRSHLKGREIERFDRALLEMETEQ